MILEITECIGAGYGQVADMSRYTSGIGFKDRTPFLHGLPTAKLDTTKVVFLYSLHPPTRYQRVP